MGEKQGIKAGSVSLHAEGVGCILAQRVNIECPWVAGLSDVS
jgi:hypothetical protein